MKGLDTPTPFLRVGPQIFQGQVEEMMGSEVIYGQVRGMFPGTVRSC
jgi:hypothetical protein